ncbi:MAG: hypothetical protein IJU14_03775 [Clostridia bacterium]|nr:hypothetical protein [Clostridia bacterium]
MNVIWVSFIVISVIYGIYNGHSTDVACAVTESVSVSTKLLLTLSVSMALWNGIMNIAEKCGIIDNLQLLFSPILKFLFPDYKNDKKVMGYISTNITANFIGIGNASTPAGLKAVSAMHNGSDTADRNLSAFVVINTASIQLIPATVATIRSAHGSNAPMEIIFCVWISSFVALAVGILSVKILFRKS